MFPNLSAPILGRSRGLLPADALTARGYTTLVSFSAFKSRAGQDARAWMVRSGIDQDQIDLRFDGRMIDLARLSSFARGGDVFVTTIYEGMGTGAHAVQASASLQPAIVLSGVLQTLAGFPAINFGAVADSRLISPFTLPAACTVAVSNLVNTVTTQRSMLGSATESGTQRLLIRSRHWCDFGDASLVPAVLTGVANVLVASVTGPGAGLISARRAGTDLGTLATNRDASLPGIVLGSTSNTSARNLDGSAIDWFFINGAQPLPLVGQVVGSLRGLAG